MHSSPVEAFSTSVPAKDVVECYMPKLFSLGWSLASITPEKNGFQVNVIANPMGHPIAVVSIADANYGTTVKVRRGSSSDRVFNRVDAALHQCAKVDL
jgi:hypothetical protein